MPSKGIALKGKCAILWFVMDEQNTLETTVQEKSTEDPKLPKELQELLDAGVYFGHKKSLVHPGMLPYIIATRNNVHIIDIEKIQHHLKRATKYLAELVSEGKTVLFAGTRPTLRDLVKQAAQDVAMPYIVTYWPGGLLTNWDTLKERITRLKELEEKQKSEEWEKYTKHERLRMTRELKKLLERWEGIKSMEKLPDAVFIVDMQQNALAAREAHLCGISVVAVADTNIDPKDIDYIIPGNDDALTSVKFILAKVTAAMQSAKK